MKRRERILSMLAGCLVGGLVIYKVCVGGVLAGYSEARAKTRELAVEWAKVQADVKVRDAMEEKYSRIEPMLANSGVEQRDISTFTRETGRVYSQRNLKVRSVRILPMTKGEYYGKLSLRVELSGEIGEILKLLGDIERMDSPVRVEEFEVSVQDRADNVRACFVISKMVSLGEKG